MPPIFGSPDAVIFNDPNAVILDPNPNPKIHDPIPKPHSPAQTSQNPIP
jgi:hypothetical protein